MVSIRHLMFAKRKTPPREAFRYVDDIYRYVFARISDAEEAEDIAMEVVHAVNPNESHVHLKTYMIGVARHKIVDYYRQHAKRKSQIVDEGEYSLDGSDDFLRIQSVLERLAENYQECLVLKYVCGFSSAEVADMMSVTPGAIDNTLQRARKAFATEWNLLHGDENE